MDTDIVHPEKFNTKYEKAINSQGNIGWYHFFLGYISQEWEILFITQTSTARPKTKPLLLSPKSVRWSTNLTELILQHSIELWMQRNEDVHGHTEKEQRQKLLQKHKQEIIHLKTLQPHMRPIDDFLFANIDTVLEATNPKELDTWIRVRRPLIYHSIKAARAQSVTKTHAITTYFTRLNNNTKPKINTRRKWIPDRLIYDPFSKKKRHKNKSTGIQARLHQYFNTGP